MRSGIPIIESIYLILFFEFKIIYTYGLIQTISIKSVFILTRYFMQTPSWMSGKIAPDWDKFHTDSMRKVFKNYTDSWLEVFLKEDSIEKVCIKSIQTIRGKSSSSTDFQRRVFFDEDSRIEVCIFFEDNWIRVCIFSDYSKQFDGKVIIWEIKSE